MRRPLAMAVAQRVRRPHDIAANAATHVATIHAVNASVVVFPGLSLTGYELICRDSGVPEHATAIALLGMDVYVASALFSFAASRRGGKRMCAIAWDEGRAFALAVLA
ncbi:hypothetical protein [Streptosporangium sp. NPDC000396]|uniref:hypothetical protein n=1 Tax=Streptosporangium sp. NPDC000396 TaxID=3366185 RepID=UPI00367A6FF8